MDEQRLSAVLVDFARTLTTDFSLQRTLDRLVQRVVEVLPVTGAGGLLMDAASEGHHFVAATDDVIRRIEGLQLALGEGPCLQAYGAGQRVLISDLAADRTFARFSPKAVEAGLGAVFAFPLRLDGQRIGALELYTSEPARLSREDVSAAQTLADVMAAYLFNARVRSDAVQSVLILQRQALHDPLTGLPNRILLHDRIEQALRTIERTDDHVGILFCDVDGLKAVNDSHGHRGGDKLLVHVAHRIAEVLRPGDTLARLSGDEFVVVCPGMARTTQAEEVADRILDSLAVPLRVGGADLAAGVSIGISVARRDGGTSLEELLHRADAAMYEVKKGGGGGWAASGAERSRRGLRAASALPGRPTVPASHLAAAEIGAGPGR